MNKKILVCIVSQSGEKRVASQMDIRRSIPDALLVANAHLHGKPRRARCVCSP